MYPGPARALLTSTLPLCKVDTRLPLTGERPGAVYWGASPFGARLPDPFAARAEAGFHPLRLSVLPLRQVLVLIAVVGDAVVGPL